MLDLLTPILIVIHVAASLLLILFILVVLFLPRGLAGFTGDIADRLFGSRRRAKAAEAAKATTVAQDA